MSSDTIEGILYQIQADAPFRARFEADPVATTTQYPLTEDERRDLIGWDVRALSLRGVSQMLIMMANNAIHGPQGIPEYLRKLNMPADSSAAPAS